MTNWIAYATPKSSARLRLFCFPFAGGGASAYRSWLEALPAGIEVLPIQYPGRETRIREAPLTRIQPMVELAAQALLPYLDRPFAFFGHSMGSLVAFELARQLHRRHGIAPGHLFASGFRAPQLPYRSALRHDLPHDQFIAQLKALEGTPREALESPELMEFLLPILRADCEICDRYEYLPGAALPCPITAFGGTEDSDAEEPALALWQGHTLGRFQLKLFSGGHFFIQNARVEVLSTLSAQLQVLLDEA